MLLAPMLCLDIDKLVNEEIKHASRNNQKGFNNVAIRNGNPKKWRGKKESAVNDKHK